jgi:hypothetical protein
MTAKHNAEILRIAAENAKLTARINKISDERAGALDAQVIRGERRIAALPATTAAALLVKARIAADSICPMEPGAEQTSAYRRRTRGSGIAGVAGIGGSPERSRARRGV